MWEESYSISKDDIMKMYAKGSEVRKPQLDNPKKADLDKDGKLSSYEVARAKKIEESMARRRTA